MKIRSGFVSNSSSSSFICEYCNHDFIGERGSHPTLCNGCLNDIPNKVTITLTKSQLEAMNCRYGDYDASDILLSLAKEYVD